MTGVLVIFQASLVADDGTNKQVFGVLSREGTDQNFYFLNIKFAYFLKLNLYMSVFFLMFP